MSSLRSSRYRSSKMCSGRGTPGNSTVESGNNGIRTLTMAAYPRPRRRGPYADRAMTTLNTVDLRGRADDARRLLPRAQQDVGAALGVVRPLCDDVRDRGIDAVRDATRR